ncbi:TPA: hypothetical protein R2P05_000300 [Campylobacter jejuni]|nr:hypothetical protein [Campylobacter jejuni]
MSIKTFIFLSAMLSTLFSQNIKNIKENTMNLTQKAREIFEKFFGKVEEKLLFTSDKEFFTNHINLLLARVLQRQICLKKSIF